MNDMQLATALLAAPLLVLTLAWFIGLAFLFQPALAPAKRREGGK